MIIKPIEGISGKIEAPSSKSYTHRVIFSGLLANGDTTFQNPLICDDTKASLESVKNFGAEADWGIIRSDGMVKPSVIDAKESGTTSRLTIAIAALADGRSKIDGDEGLRKRPMKPLLDALETMDINVKSNEGKLPVVIRGGNFNRNEVEISGNISSQFVTALLFMGTKIGLRIKVTGELVSKPYVEMSLDVLRKACVDIEKEDNSYIVKKGINPTDFHVPGDYSSASFLLAAGAIFGKITVKNLKKNSAQADRKIVDILKKIGADVTLKEDKVNVVKDELNGIKLDCSNFPDLFPILTVLGIFSEGETIITGKQLRFKESDRIRSMVDNLKRMGAEIDEFEKGVVVRKSNLKGAEIDPKGDHRIAMAMSIAALGADGYSIIKEEDCVSKSYPRFFDDLKEVVKYGN